MVRVFSRIVSASLVGGFNTWRRFMECSRVAGLESAQAELSESVRARLSTQRRVREMKFAAKLLVRGAARALAAWRRYVERRGRARVQLRRVAAVVKGGGRRAAERAAERAHFVAWRVRAAELSAELRAAAAAEHAEAHAEAQRRRRRAVLLRRLAARAAKVELRCALHGWRMRAALLQLALRLSPPTRAEHSMTAAAAAAAASPTAPETPPKKPDVSPVVEKAQDAAAAAAAAAAATAAAPVEVTAGENGTEGGRRRPAQAGARYDCGPPDGCDPG